MNRKQQNYQQVVILRVQQKIVLLESQVEEDLSYDGVEMRQVNQGLLKFGKYQQQENQEENNQGLQYKGQRYYREIQGVELE